MSMAEQPPEAALKLPLSEAKAAERPLHCCPAAEEVVSLFDHLRDRLLRYVISFGLPVEDAEDVIQEVFLSLYRHLERGRSRSNLRAWVFRVAHNLALKQRNQLRSASQESQDERASLLDWLPDPGPNPEDRMVSSQRRERMLATVNALAEQDRRCLILRAEGLRYREIAQILDISLGSVALSLERSLTRLARAAQW
ncbi:MAG TPA: sigma-70 family RNA polymerase sigma factor [Bryobacteraceae bacterium]|jgi:RNA polymerase sigma-70 factor (ECF subfamily)|nr:sigma-70 family RNA polymerase sigma factor [Bryobacteraceae bacterium]